MSDNDLKSKINELENYTTELEFQVMRLDKRQSESVKESQLSIISILELFKKSLAELAMIANVYVRNNYAGFRQAVEQNLEGIMILNPEGIVLFANPTVKKWFSHYGEVLGEKIGIPIAGANQHGEVNILRGNKSEPGLAEMSVTEIIWEEQIAYLVMLHDVTELKSAEQEAKAASRAKSAFLANMSHELRTPLNAILGYTQILQRDTSLNDKHLQGLEIIHRSGKHLLSLINDILELSKIEAEQLKLQPINFDLDNFLTDITALFQWRAEQKGIAFNYKKMTPLPRIVFGDEKRLRQIIINLLSNAIKFTRHGGVFLQISARKDRLLFRVEDTGIGVPEEDLERIFLPFQQGSNQHQWSEGTGLGLTIAKKLIELMNGEVHVESITGKGSVFWTELELPSAEGGMTPNRYEKMVITGYGGDKRRILIVEDKAENRAVLISLLEPLGFEVLEATNGEEGIEIARKYLPDLILMDLVMPVLDGFTATRQIKETPELKNVVVIAVSASVFDAPKESLSAGCDSFIPKPINFDKLLEQLSQYLKIKWVYANPVVSNTVPVFDSTDELPSSTTLSAEQASLLLHLVRSGDVCGIREFVDELKQTDEKLIPFADKIHHFAEKFQLDRLRDLAEHCLPH
ncbi:MAG: hypothetical protein BWK79_08890 [Beggiatoa sp. IS2]|nr:MAG: hypothetical protein BWK79_08890 [Beggiatoa sp. IS2]